MIRPLWGPNPQFIIPRGVLGLSLAGALLGLACGRRRDFANGPAEGNDVAIGAKLFGGIDELLSLALAFGCLALCHGASWLDNLGDLRLHREVRHG